VYFGEYVGNPERHEIHIDRLPLGGTRLEIVHTFEPGAVLHGSLWHLRDGQPGRRALAIAKDFLPVRFFQAGTWQFAQGPGWGSELFVHLMGLKGDNRTYALRSADAERVAAAVVPGRRSAH
jgi:hypothetical protein